MRKSMSSSPHVLSFLGKTECRFAFHTGVFMSGIAVSLSKIGVSLLLQLVTESFIKSMIIHSLECLVKKTQTDVDDNLLQAVKDSWKV